MPNSPMTFGQLRRRSCGLKAFRAYDKLRPNSAARGYGRRWREYRKSFLMSNPLCASCLSAGLTVPATVIDHIVPHRGDMRLFWDKSNHQALCKRCHDRKTAKGL
jgi:5-methylcytosine-specific restriction protein A